MTTLEMNAVENAIAEKDKVVEGEIISKGLTGPRITPDVIDALMARVEYKSHVPYGTTTTFVHGFLDGTFLIAGASSSCVSKENFNAELGFKIAKDKAIAMVRDKLWELEGYSLKKSLDERITIA